VVVSSKLATLHELDTVYSTQDLYDLLEIVIVDARNRKIANTSED
jgi:4-diphosphocytidyl-2C-methyl-D-erythritol kinase